MAAPAINQPRAETRETDAPKKSILDQILDHHSVVADLTPLMPKGVSMSRIKAAVKLEARKNPSLKACTPESLVDAISRGLRMDLDIGTEYFLVPFSESYKDADGEWRKRLVCTGIVNYKSHVALAMRCGAIRSADARCVYAGERFEIEHGLAPKLLHVPETDATKRGPLVGAYYVLRLPRNEVLFDFVPIADIEAVRAQSKQWNPKKAPECPPWWARKRAIIVGLGLIPKNPRHQLVEARLAADDAHEFTDELDAINDLAGAPNEDDDYRPRPVMDHGDDPYGAPAHADTREED